MFVVIFIKALGRLLAWTPLPLVALFTQAVGRLIYHLPIARMREMKSNIHHAFPDKEAAWHQRVGKLTSINLVEMATFAVASPFLSRRWLERHFTMTDAVREQVSAGMAGGGINLMPHVTYFEMTAAVPALIPEALEQPVMFRPLDIDALNDWVKTSRERWGARLLSRKDGMRPIMHGLRDGKCLTVLFDQNAGKRGTLIFFFGRVASATHLPELLSRKFDVPVYLMIPRRIGCWRVELNFERLPSADVIHASHSRLEAYLSHSAEQAADWLWFHNRWSVQSKARHRFYLRDTDCLLDESAAFQGLSHWPKRNRLWFRMPNWLGDVVMALPLVRAVKVARPDAEITLVAPAAMRPLLERVGIADCLLDLPDKNASSWCYFREVARWREAYPDVYFCFTNSTRGDLEAHLTQAPRRLGMLRRGKRRPLLTDPWPLPVEVDETTCHQVDVWEKMFHHYGLRGAIDRRPLVEHVEGSGFGLICGTENNPEKRWPVAHWQGLLKRLLEETSEMIYLYGTPRDREITDAVAAGSDSERVINLAGETNLSDYLDHLSGCRAVFCNDTGGMHLANMLGVPVYAIFGPTNPIRTGPIFHAVAHIIQPIGCAPTGGEDISRVSVDQIWERFRSDAL